MVLEVLAPDEEAEEPGNESISQRAQLLIITSTLLHFERASHFDVRV